MSNYPVTQLLLALLQKGRGQTRTTRIYSGIFAPLRLCVTFFRVTHFYVYMRADCFANSAEAPVLLGVLFPQRPSWLRPLG